MEFGAWDVDHLPEVPNPALRSVLDDFDGLAFEAHSTDYQRPDAFRRLAEMGFAVLKVGPALTFAYRKAIYALDVLAEAPGIGLSRHTTVRAAAEEVMVGDPSYWQSHYFGADDVVRQARHFSLSDRIRYYWPRPELAAAVQDLRDGLSGHTLRRPVLAQVFGDDVIDRAAAMTGAKDHVDALVLASIEGRPRPLFHREPLKLGGLPRTLVSTGATCRRISPSDGVRAIAAAPGTRVDAAYAGAITDRSEVMNRVAATNAEGAGQGPAPPAATSSRRVLLPLLQYNIADGVLCTWQHRVWLWIEMRHGFECGRIPAGKTLAGGNCSIWSIAVTHTPYVPQASTLRRLVGAGFLTIAGAAAWAQPVPISGLSPNPDGGDPNDPAAVTLCNGAPQTGVVFRNSEVEPHIAVNPTDPDNMIAGWHQDRWSTGGGQSLGVAYTLDGGATWQQSEIPFTRCSGGEGTDAGDFERASDPWISFSPDGTAHYMSLSFKDSVSENAMAVASSDDGGVTWSEPVIITGSPAQDANGRSLFHDKNTLTADPNDPNIVYATWTLFRWGNTTLLFSKSNRWRKVVEARPSHCGICDCRPGRAGVLSARALRSSWGRTGRSTISTIASCSDLMTSQVTFDQATFRSDDQGKHWEKMESQISTLVSANAFDPELFYPPGIPVRDAGEIPDVAVNRTDGTLYTVWQTGRPDGLCRHRHRALDRWRIYLVNARTGQLRTNRRQRPDLPAHRGGQRQRPGRRVVL